jgi:hypothetical protein
VCYTKVEDLLALNSCSDIISSDSFPSTAYPYSASSTLLSPQILLSELLLYPAKNIGTTPSASATVGLTLTVCARRGRRSSVDLTLGTGFRHFHAPGSCKPVAPIEKAQ